MNRGGARPNTGYEPHAGTPRLHVLRFRVTDAELAEISATVPEGELSDWCRRLLLERVRR